MIIQAGQPTVICRPKSALLIWPVALSVYNSRQADVVPKSDKSAQMNPATRLHSDGVLGAFSDYEKIYLNMSRTFAHMGKEHWAIHCVCSFQHASQNGGADTASALKLAWKALLLEYPGLSVRPDGYTKHFVQLSESVVEEWANETFVVELDLSADEVISSAEPKALPYLFFLPPSSEIVFLSQHWRHDALGTCILLNRLFEILAAQHDVASPPKMRSTILPSPSLECAAGAIDDEDSELQDYARKYIDDFHRKAVHSGGLPFEGDATTTPDDTAHLEIIFDSTETAALVASCKARNISVSAAVHTALAKTVFSFSSLEERGTDYTTVMAVNMRGYLPSPYNTKAHACQTYVASITPTVSHSRSFDENAVDLTLAYRNWYSEEFLQSLKWIYKYHAAKLFAPRPPGATAPKPPSGITLSSLGVIEQYLTGHYGQAVKVDTFRFGVSMMTRQTLLYAWTFRGRLCLSLDYNSAYYKGEMAEDVLSRVRSYLEEGLAISPTCLPEGTTLSQTL